MLDSENDNGVVEWGLDSACADDLEGYPMLDESNSTATALNAPVSDIWQKLPVNTNIHGKRPSSVSTELNETTLKRPKVDYSREQECQSLSQFFTERNQDILTVLQARPPLTA